jgi:hypothetical protein
MVDPVNRDKGYAEAFEHIVASRNGSLPAIDLDNENIKAFFRPDWGNALGEGITNLKSPKDITAFEVANNIHPDRFVGPQVLAARLGRLDPSLWQFQAVNTFGNAWYPTKGRGGMAATAEFLKSFDKLAAAVQKGADIYKRNGEKVSPVEAQAFLKAYNDAKGPKAKIAAARAFLNTAGFNVRDGNTVDGAAAHALMDFGLANHPKNPLIKSASAQVAAPATAAPTFSANCDSLIRELDKIKGQPAKADDGALDDLRSRYREMITSYMNTHSGRPAEEDVPRLKALHQAFTGAADELARLGGPADVKKADQLRADATMIGSHLQKAADRPTTIPALTLDNYNDVLTGLDGIVTTPENATEASIGALGQKLTPWLGAIKNQHGQFTSEDASRMESLEAKLVAAVTKLGNVPSKQTESAKLWRMWLDFKVAYTTPNL